MSNFSPQPSRPENPENPLSPAPTYSELGSQDPNHKNEFSPGLVPIAGTQPVHPQGLATPVAPTRPQSPYPTGTYSYIETLRGERRRWWKPLVATFIFAPGYFFLAMMVMIPEVLYLFLSNKISASTDSAQMQAQMMKYISNTADPLAQATLMASVIVMMPLAMLLTYLIFRQKPGTIWSIAGGIRWKWLGICVGSMMLIHGGTLAVLSSVSGEVKVTPRSDFWLVLVLIIILVPLQTATEEYVFRGWFMQMIGSWIPRPAVAYVVGAVAMVPVFAIMHGTTDPLLLVDLACFAIFATYLVWLTGGLEASISVHFANNFVLFIIDALSGGSHSSLATDNKGSVGSILLGCVLYLIEGTVLTLIWKRMSKRGAISRFTTRTDNLNNTWDSELSTKEGINEQPGPA